MNYKATPKANDTNVRDAASTMGGIIQKVGVNDILEGDVFLKDAQGREWLAVLLINGIQTTKPTFVATWVCNIEVIPPVVPGLAVQVELTFVSETPVSITLNGVPVGQEQYSGTIVIAPVG